MNGLHINPLEAKRLDALQRYPMVGTPAEPRFDELARLAAEVCQAPVAMISMVDQDQLWFKARYNYAAESAPRDGSFCEQVILHDDALVIEDASEHALFKDSPLVTCPSGVRFYAGMPLRASTGEPIGVLCTIDTQPRTLTDQQVQALQILSRQVMAQMELSLMAQSAREQVSKLNTLNQNKDRYLAILAHDLRSSFHGIMAFSEVLDTEYDDMDDAAIRKIASYLNHASHSTYSLLENLLEWSMLKSGNMSFKPRWLSLDELLSEISNSVILNARHKEIELDMPTGSCPRIFGDANMLRSLLQNLLSNAIKFTPKQGQVSLSCGQTEQGVLSLTITDSGIGMSPERVQTLFEHSIGQTNRGTSGEHGSGLGLSLCKQFVERHGGKIWATSVEGQGTTIHIELPQPQLEPSATEVAEEA